MKKFIQEILNTAYKQGGKTYQFVSGCVRRTEEFLVKNWKVYIEKSYEMAKADNVEVFLILYQIRDQKLWKYQAQQDKIISELNYLLAPEGIKWVVTRTDNFFRTDKLVHFILTRTVRGLEPGKPSLWQVVQLIGQILIMKGFYITDVQIKEKGILLYQAWSVPSATDIYELENLLTYTTSENVIDSIVETTIGEYGKPQPGTIERIKSIVTMVLIIVIIVAVIYYVDKFTKIGERGIKIKKEVKKLWEDKK